MSKTSRRNAIVVSVLIVALCAAVIGGATFALYSAGDTHNITVTSGDIQLSSTVKLTSAWTTAQSGEKTDANVTDNKTAALSTGGSVSVDEGGNITFDRIALGDGATFEVTLSMAYTINMKYSLVLSAQGASEFLRNNLEITVGEDSANSLANGDIYIIPWTAAEALGDNEASKEGSATATFTISLPWSAEDSAVSGSESLTLSLTASGVQSNALTGITTESGGNFSTLKEAAQSASATDTIILGNDMTNAVWTEEVSAAAGNKELTVVGAGANTTALSVNAALPANVTLSNLAVTDDLVLQSGASLEDVTVNGNVTVNGASSRAAVMSLANETQVSGGKSVFNGVTFKEGLVLNNADVTITNSTINNYGSGKSNQAAVYVTGGSLALGDGNYFSTVGPNSVIAAFGATVTITGGEYVASTDMAINPDLDYQDGKALALYSNSSATISGGKLDSRANNQTVQLGSFDEDNPETNTSASLTFTGGEITSYNVGIAIFNSSSFIMDGGSIAADGYAVSSNNLAGSDTFTIDINGGSLASGDLYSAFYMPAPGTLTLDNCAVTAGAILDARFGNIAIGANVTLEATNKDGQGNLALANEGVAEGSAIILHTSRYTVKPEGAAGSLTLTVADGANITSATGMIFGVYNWTNADKEDVSLNFGSFAGDKDAIAYYNAASATSVTRMSVIPAAVDGKYGAVGYATLAEASTAGVTNAEIIYDLNDTSSSSVNVTIWEGVNVTGANVGSLTARGANTLENVTAASSVTIGSNTSTEEGAAAIDNCTFKVGAIFYSDATVTGGSIGVSSASKAYSISVSYGSNVTFNNVTMNFGIGMLSVTKKPAYDIAAVIDNPSTVTLESCTLTGSGSAVLSASESNIIANGSNITSTGSSGTIKADKSTVKLTGCTISTTSKAGSAAGSAIHATNSSSVTLDGTSITSNDTFGIAVMSGSNVALNNNSSITAKNSYGIVVYANSDATVNNSTVNADLPIYAYGENANVVVDGSNSVISSNALTSTAVQSGYYDKSKKIPYTGSFTLKNGKVEGGIFASGSGVVNIEGGSVHAAYLAISNNNTTTDGTSINISGGSVTVDDDVAIYLPGDGAFTMTGGSVTGGTAIDVRMGTVTITGGTLTSTYNQNAPLDELTDVNGGTMMDGSVIMVNSGLYLNTAGELAGITVTIGKDVIMNKTAEEADYVRHYDWNQNEQPASITVENEAYTIAHYALQDGTVSKQEA